VLTGVVERAVVLEQHHLAVEVDDLLPHPQQLLRRPRLRRAHRPVLQQLHPVNPTHHTNQTDIRGEETKRICELDRTNRWRSSNYLLPDDVLLLLLEEEGVELVELGVEEGDEPGLLRGHRRRGAAAPHALALAPPLAVHVAGADLLEPLLEVLVGQELVAPLGERLHDLVVQALAELHCGCGRNRNWIELWGNSWWNAGVGEAGEEAR
jgi:hypothetical protein